MRQYLSLYKQLISINFSVLLAYRANLVGHIIVTAVWTFLTLFTTIIVTNKAKVVVGWTQGEMLLLAGGLTILIGTFSFLFKKGFQHMPETILYGDLDGLLLKPIDSQFLISMMYVHFTSLLRTIVGFLFVAYVVMHFHMTVTFISVLSFVILLCVGLMMYYSIWLFAVTLLIWFPRLSNLLEVVNSLNHVSRYPPEIFREFNSFLFLFLLPYTLLLATPVKVLLHHSSLLDVAIMLCTAGFMVFLSRKFWKFALRFYGSASS